MHISSSLLSTSSNSLFSFFPVFFSNLRLLNLFSDSRGSGGRADDISMSSYGKAKGNSVYDSQREPLYYPLPYATTHIPNSGHLPDTAESPDRSLQRGQVSEHAYDVPHRVQVTKGQCELEFVSCKFSRHAQLLFLARLCLYINITNCCVKYPICLLIYFFPKKNSLDEILKFE